MDLLSVLITVSEFGGYGLSTFAVFIILGLLFLGRKDKRDIDIRF